jgi:O-antigen/teichoic acid export membrane protein
MQSRQIHGGLLARNTAFNFVGSLVPLAVALVVTPYMIRGLGLERFGVLSLAWAILWYSSYFDLGLTRATTKFTSQVIGKLQPEKIPAILWTSLGIQTLLGGIAAAGIYITTHFLVGRVLHIPMALSRESELAFYGIGATIPVFLAVGILSALLAGAHRFDLINAVKIPGNSLMFLFPALGVYLGYRLPGIVALMVLSRALMALVLLLMCWKIFPGLGSGPRMDKSITRPLLSFGGWVMVCNILIPILIYVDRFVIGAVLSIAAVAYYSVASEVVGRLQLVPGSVGSALFPAFSTFSVEDPQRLERLYARSLKTMLLLMVPAGLLLIVFAREALRLWVGTEFAVHSSQTLQVLAVGLVLNALGQMPTNLLDAVGRPDLRAKVFLMYVLPYLAALWFFVHRFGILGAAIAWTARSALELTLFLVVVSRHLRLPLFRLAENGMRKALGACGALAAVLLLLFPILRAGLFVQGLVVLSALVGFCAVTWRFVLDKSDRRSLRGAVGYDSSY